MTDQISQSARFLDITPRIAFSNTVAASPALAAITTVCTLTIPSNLTIVTGVMVWGEAAFTVGTSGTACKLQIRQTNTAGSIIYDTGAVTGGIAAANLVTLGVQGFDTAPPAAGVYVMCLTVTAGAAISTVSAASLFALAI